MKCILFRIAPLVQASIFSAIVLTTALFSSVDTCQAASFGTLEWVDRTGTVSGTDTIPVQFRLTLDPASVPLTIGPGGSGEPISGLEQADLDSLAADFPNFTITDASLSHSFYSGGTFSDDTNPPPYQFQFSNSFPFSNVSLVPGVPTIIEHGQFVPSPVPAPPGTYFHYRSEINLVVTGLNSFGDSFERDFLVAQVACSDGDTSCAFQRTVTPVPIPAAVWLFGSGVIGLVGLARRT
ncbi:MAG: hypothetical protein E8D42_07515 [Nitrospira sp.]|nr:MAG: hypothetical protein E8D42_07515 [Nitrospira sp.]